MSGWSDLAQVAKVVAAGKAAQLVAAPDLGLGFPFGGDQEDESEPTDE